MPDYSHDHNSSFGLGHLFHDSSAHAAMPAPMASAQYLQTGYDDGFANFAPGAQGNGFPREVHDEYQVQEFTYPDPDEAFNIMPHPYAAMIGQNTFQPQAPMLELQPWAMAGASSVLESTPKGESSSSQGTSGGKRRQSLIEQDSPTNNRKRASTITTEPLRLVPLTAARTGFAHQPITNTAIPVGESSEAPQVDQDFFFSLDPALFTGVDAHDAANSMDTAQTAQSSRLRVRGPMRQLPLTQEGIEYDERHHDPNVSELNETTIVVYIDPRRWRLVSDQAQPSEAGEAHLQAGALADRDDVSRPEIPGPSESGEAPGTSAPWAHEEGLFFRDSDDEMF